MQTTRYIFISSKICRNSHESPRPPNLTLSLLRGDDLDFKTRTQTGFAQECNTNERSQRSTEAGRRPVHNIYRFPTQVLRARRHQSIRNTVVAQFDIRQPPAVATATIVVRDDGSVSTCAKGCEADTAQLLARGLKRLARRIESAFFNDA